MATTRAHLATMSTVASTITAAVYFIFGDVFDAAPRARASARRQGRKRRCSDTGSDTPAVFFVPASRALGRAAPILAVIVLAAVVTSANAQTISTTRPRTAPDLTSAPRTGGTSTSTRSSDGTQSRFVGDLPDCTDCPAYCLYDFKECLMSWHPIDPSTCPLEVKSCLQCAGDLFCCTDKCDEVCEPPNVVCGSSCCIGPQTCGNTCQCECPVGTEICGEECCPAGKECDSTGDDCVKEGCDTAFALDDGDLSVPFCDNDELKSNRWGWTNGLYPVVTEGDPGKYNLDIYAGAGQCDTNKGVQVGTASVVVSNAVVTVEVTPLSGYEFTELQIQVSCNPLQYALKNNGDDETVAPGQYTYSNPSPVGTTKVVFTVGAEPKLEGPCATTTGYWVIVHAVSCATLA